MDPACASSNCGVAVGEPGTDCDPSRPTCPKPTPFPPGTSAPCCDLCTMAFVPELDDPIIKPGEAPLTGSIPFKADQNGYIMPTLGPITLPDPSKPAAAALIEEGSSTLALKKGRSVGARRRLLSLGGAKAAPAPKPAPGAAGAGSESAAAIKRCCYPCAAAQYNGSPGDAAFGEPQTEMQKLNNLFRPLNLPNANFRNRRVYSAGKTGQGVFS